MENNGIHNRVKYCLKFHIDRKLKYNFSNTSILVLCFSGTHPTHISIKLDKLPLQIWSLSTMIRLLGNDPINQDLSDWNFWSKILWHVLNKLPKSDIYCKSKCNANDFISSLNPSSGNFQCRQVDTQLDKMNSDGAFSISISLFFILLLQ